MSPIDWAKRPIQKYADFSGRAPRAEYWWYTLALVIVGFILGFIEGIAGLSGMVGPYGPLTALLVLALLVPGIAVTIRRLHDTNRSGWWILVALVPYAMLGFMMARSGAMAAEEPDMAALASLGIFSIIAMIGAIVLLVLMVLPGTRGPNKYGPDPYGEDVEKVFA